VLSAVSEKTGYPIEVLDLDLDLEADLGIDTVKQAELFASIRSLYNIPRREDLRLSDYNTLAKVIAFVTDSLGSMNAPVVLPKTVAQPVISETVENIPQAVANSPVADPAEIKTYVLSVVSEKTGYPIEVLDLDLDLEADLGIDTVKQAELFASIRGQYNIPRREDLRLSDYNTLAKVIAFVRDSLPSVTAPLIQPAISEMVVNVFQTAAVSSPDPAEIKSYVLSVVSEKTGYPTEVLDLDLDLEADLGIDTVKQAELFASIRGQYNIPRREDLRLSDYNTLAKVIHFVEDSLSAASAPPVETIRAVPIVEESVDRKSVV
jgi:uncharacterized ubiquitin-like protein YukD